MWRAGLIVILFLFAISGKAQKPAKVKILNTDSLVYNKTVDPDLRMLIGNVIFQHDSALMFCDRAFFYKEKNRLEAYDNVHIKQGDTLNLYGDYMEYDGDSRIAKIRNRVKLIDNEIELTTDSLNYNREKETAHYFGGGKIIDTANTLVSESGFYFKRSHELFFKDSVVLTNPEYIITSDTLKYITTSEISYFFGPTEILGDSNFIYCENGWYDTKNDISQFNKNAYFVNKSSTLSGDSLYYDRIKGYGKALKNVSLIDTVENINLYGNFIEYFENIDYAILTDSAMAVQIFENDSLFVHADTMISTYSDEEQAQVMIAFYKVKIFREDMQGMCDSISFSMKDSVTRMFGSPVLWSEENQMKAEKIEIFSKDNSVNHIDFHTNSIIIQKDNIERFNQIAGKNMTAHLKDNELYKIDVDGNGQTLYYPKDDKDVIGVNSAQASKLTIFIRERRIDKLVFHTKPDAKLVPPDHFSEEEKKLKNFIWLEKHRPQKKEDIFIW